MSLEKEISRGIMEAMKSRDAVRLAALRNVKKYIIEAKTSGAGIAELPDADVVKIISKLAKQGADSAAIYTGAAPPGPCRRGDGTGRRFAGVPAPAAFGRGADCRRAGDHRRDGASSLGEMGRVMGVASKRLTGRAEGRAISDKVRELLAR